MSVEQQKKNESLRLAFLGCWRRVWWGKIRQVIASIETRIWCRVACGTYVRSASRTWYFRNVAICRPGGFISNTRLHYTDYCSLARSVESFECLSFWTVYCNALWRFL